MEQKIFVNIKNARGRIALEQKLQKSIDTGQDPFDPQYLSNYHSNPIVKVWDYWYATESEHAYPGSNHHILLICNEYAETLTDISKEAFSELYDIISELNEKYEIPGGGFWMRYGNTNSTGATVKRLHAHLISKDPEGNGVRIPLG